MPSDGDEFEDPYETLGIEEEASDKEINAAFRKLSLKWHPDKNPDNKEVAEKKFAEISDAKELLLDPVKRAEVDKHRKAKRDLVERYSQEDAKRRELREDLERREGRPGKPSFAEESKEARHRKFAAADFASRIRAREAELESQRAKVTTKAAEAREDLEDARVRITWRGDAPSPLAVAKALESFGFRSLQLHASEGVALLDSREDALRAVLHCRERRHQMAFRVALAPCKRGMPEGSGAEPAAAKKPKIPSAETAPQSSGKKFGDWESSMLDGLLGLAKAQKCTQAA